MKRIGFDSLVEFGVRLLAGRGVPRATAERISRLIVEAEAFRQSTHGIVLFKAIDGKLDEGLAPAGEPEVVRDAGGMGLIDGSRCLGLLAYARACEMAQIKARDHGVAFVGVRNTTWVGALGIPLVALARAGLLVQAWAQTNTCRDCAPVGGIDARFSTNPMALAIPTAGDPILADFSTATMSLSAAAALAARGARATTPRFLDDHGNATDDPAVLDAGGSLLFAGGDVDGHKAYAMSLFIEALTVVIGGSANNPEVPMSQSLALVAIDPASFAGAEYYTAEMKRFQAHVRTSRVRPGWEGVRFPGERGFAALAESRARGVPLDERKLEILRDLATRHGLEPVG